MLTHFITQCQNVTFYNITPIIIRKVYKYHKTAKLTVAYSVFQNSDFQSNFIRFSLFSRITIIHLLVILSSKNNISMRNVASLANNPNYPTSAFPQNNHPIPVCKMLEALLTPSHRMLKKFKG